MHHGHFGRPSTIAAIAVGAAILAYFLVPFGVVEFDGPAAPKDDVLLAGEVGNMYEDAPRILTPASWSMGLMVTGLVIALVGVLILMILGRQPLEVDMARWMGAVGGATTVVGSAMALLPAAYHFGTGFNTFLGMVFFTEFRSQFWAISPVLITLACLVAIHTGLQVMVKVAANRDGIRDRSAMHADGVRFGMLFLVAMLLVPWSIGILPDGVSDSLSITRADDGTAPLFFSAQDVQGATPSELINGGRLRYSGDADWSLMKVALSVMQIAPWAALGVGVLGALAATAESTGVPATLSRAARGLTAIVLLAWIVAGIFYAITWFTFTPRDGTGHTFLPGFLHVAVPVVGLLAARIHWRIFQDDVQPAPAHATAA